MPRDSIRGSLGLGKRLKTIGRADSLQAIMTPWLCRLGQSSDGRRKASRQQWHWSRPSLYHSVPQRTRVLPLSLYYRSEGTWHLPRRSQLCARRQDSCIMSFLLLTLSWSKFISTSKKKKISASWLVVFWVYVWPYWVYSLFSPDPYLTSLSLLSLFCVLVCARCILLSHLLYSYDLSRVLLSTLLVITCPSAARWMIVYIQKVIIFRNWKISTLLLWVSSDVIRLFTMLFSFINVVKILCCHRIMADLFYENILYIMKAK